MKPVCRVTTVMFAWLSLAPAVRAQEPAARSPAASLALDEVIAYAIAHEPSIRVAAGDVAVALGSLTQASARPNPIVNGEHRFEPGGSDRASSIGVEWPLDLFRRSARIASAEEAVSTVRFAAADRGRLVRAAMRASYGDAAAAKRAVAIADELTASLTRQLDLMRARVTEGAARPLDRDLLEVELARLRAERARAAGRADRALLVLKQQMGMSPDQALELRDSLEAVVSRLSTEPAVGAAPTLSERNDVKEAQARITLAAAQVEEARSEGKFDVSVTGGYMRMNSGVPQLGFTPGGSLTRVQGRFDYLSVGAMAKLPLFDRNQGRVEAARAQQIRAAAMLEGLMLAARSEVAIARASLLRAREALEPYIGATRSLARQNLDVVRQTFELGRSPVFDVINEQRRYLEFELAYTEALREVWDAEVAVLKAAGESR